jgi:hypothetical protein
VNRQGWCYTEVFAKLIYMYCPNCGQESREDANYCRSCGTSLSEDFEQEASLITGVSVEREEDPVTYDTATDTVNDVYYQPISDTSPKLPVVLKVVGGVVVFSNAALISIDVVRAIVSLFDSSLGLGLVVILTPVGWIVYVIPLIAAWGGGSVTVEWAEGATNTWELYGKAIAGLIATLIVPWLVLFVMHSILIAFV